MNERPLILVVDDEESILKLLRANLSVDGYGVVTAADGKQALEVLEECNPDLVLLDIMMPELDGFQVLRMMRERSTVPIIMLTAKSDIACVEKTLYGGADGYVTKPFSIEVLSARVRDRLTRVS